MLMALGLFVTDPLRLAMRVIGGEAFFAVVGGLVGQCRSDFKQWGHRIFHDQIQSSGGFSFDAL